MRGYPKEVEMALERSRFQQGHLEIIRARRDNVLGQPRLVDVMPLQVGI